MSDKRPFLFWSTFFLVLYTYLGYPVLAAVLAKYKRRPVAKGPVTPEVTILVPAYNEALTIAAKIENCLALEYPAGKLKILVVSDGSSDATTEIARRYEGVTVLFDSDQRGKAAAINRAMPQIESEIILISDANAMLTPGSLMALVANFADPEVGAVAGEKRVMSGGEGIYWRYESFLKKNDSQFGSVMGAAGEIFALRKKAFLPVREDAILEDFVLSMRLVASGWRVVYEPQAIAWEMAALSLVDDFERRSRIAAGGFQAISRLTEMLNPHLGWPFWQYLSHRVMRWVVAPFMLPVLFLTNLTLLSRPFYKILLAGQLALYVSGLWGYILNLRGKNDGLFSGVFYFFLANVAALAGFWRFVSGRQPVPWRKAGRSLHDPTARS